MFRFRVVNHDAKKLQVAVRVTLVSVSKEAGGRLRVYQFWPKALNLARENLRSPHGQKPGFWPKPRRMFRPESPRSRFGKPNFIPGWIASVDSEISIIDLLRIDCRKLREKESKQNRPNPVHIVAPEASTTLSGAENSANLA
jgi:hypothetical protein